MGFRPPLCTYRLNWARGTGWWDEWNYTALQTQDSKFVPWRSEAEQATSRSRRFPAILALFEWVGKNILFLWNLEDQSGVRTRDLRLSKQAALITTPGPPQHHREIKHLVRPWKRRKRVKAEWVWSTEESTKANNNFFGLSGKTNIPPGYPSVCSQSRSNIMNWY